MNKQKHAVVTGASKGIGFGVCEALLKRNYQVWGISRTKPKHDLEDNFHWIEFDLAKTELIINLAKKLPSTIDLLINDAGVWEMVQLANLTPEHLAKTMDINFIAPVLLTTSLLSRMNDGSSIINISSEMGIITEDGYGIYSASKAALDRFTTTLAKEQTQINVIGILPAPVDTDGARAVYNYNIDPERITVEELVGVVIKAIDGGFKSGSLVLAFNNESLPYLKTRDKYTLVNIDNKEYWI